MLYLISFIIGAFTGVMLTCLVVSGKGKGQVMNRGTKVRVIAFAVACVNQSIASVGAVDLGNETANLIYNIISLAFTIAAGSFALYYNNDFTVEGETGTKLTREMKKFRGETVTETIEPDDAEVVEDGEE